MALANVADALARTGLKVLMIDFDLEAPGLEQFFQVNQEEVRRHLGLLDLLLGYKRAMSVAKGEETAIRDLRRFICDVYPSLGGGGWLDLLPAGQRQTAEQLAQYALSLRTFDWQDFYFNWEGERFFEWLRRSLTPEPYDLVLVDSRTGVTEMGGICGYQLADTLVMLCAANHQNIQGTTNMVNDFRSPTVEALRGGRRLEIIVVPARVEQRDAQLIEAFFQRFEQAFGGLMPAALRTNGLTTRELAIPYEPAYAFEERVVTDPARAAERKHIGTAFRRLAKAIALLAAPEAKLAAAGRQLAAERDTSEASSGSGSVSSSASGSGLPGSAGAAAEVDITLPDATATERLGTAAHGGTTDIFASLEPSAAPDPQYDVAKRFATYDAYIDYARVDESLVSKLVQYLERHGLRVFLDAEETVSSADFESVVSDALFHSRALVTCIGHTGLSELRQQTLERAFAAEQGHTVHVVPVLLPGARPESLWGGRLASLASLDFRAGLSESGLDRLAEELRERATEAPRVQTMVRCPFPGARPLDEEDANLFFGREQCVRDLLDRIERLGSIVVIGPSGCGKTSLVQAGLVPALRRAAERGHPWAVVRVEIGRQPLSALAMGLVALIPNATAQSARDSDWEARPDDFEALFHDVLAHDRNRSVLIFLDQLERLLTQTPKGASQLGFARVAARLLAQPPERVATVAAVRADAVAALAGLDVLGSQLDASRFEVPPFTGEEWREVIEKPAQRVGLAFEPGLIDRLVANVQGEPGALPHLQDMLHHLWVERRGGWLTNAAFDAVGGLRRAIPARADAVLETLGELERSTARSIFLHLVQVGGGVEGVRRRVPIEKLMPAGGAEDLAAGARAVLDTLVEARLLVTSAIDGKPSIEPAHEALVRRWPRLRGWIEQDYNWLEWRERLDVSVGEWRHAGCDTDLLLRGAPLEEALMRRLERPEELSVEEKEFLDLSVAQRDKAVARRERRRRWVLTTAGIIAVWSVILAGIAIWKAKEARQANAQVQQEYTYSLDLAEQRSAAAEAQLESTKKEIVELRKNIDTLQRIAKETSEALAKEAAQRSKAEDVAAKARAAAAEAQSVAGKAQESLTNLGTNVETSKQKANQQLDTIKYRGLAPR
jgi:hypothetical protein